MCGIAGIIDKNAMDVSSKILEMLTLIQHRGSDASGIALFDAGHDVILRVAINQPANETILDEVVERYGKILNVENFDNGRGVSFREMTLKMDRDRFSELHLAINAVNGLYVHSLGKGLKVYKDGGTIDNLKSNHRIDTSSATHGIGHVRLATESAEDINAAHPFVSPFYPELTIVHNGQFTNYFNVRRMLESKGAIFKTLNDSEAASHLIAYAMEKNGGNLEAALNYALEELDGIFCIIAATHNQIGFVKDRLGIKPLLLYEKDGVVLFGSEQIEFTAVLPDVFAEEIEPGEVRVWNI